MQAVHVYSHDRPILLRQGNAVVRALLPIYGGPIRRRRRANILTMDPSCCARATRWCGRCCLFVWYYDRWRTNQTQTAREYSHDGPILLRQGNAVVRALLPAYEPVVARLAHYGNAQIPEVTKLVEPVRHRAQILLNMLSSNTNMQPLGDRPPLSLNPPSPSLNQPPPSLNPPSPYPNPTSVQVTPSVPESTLFVPESTLFVPESTLFVPESTLSVLVSVSALATKSRSDDQVVLGGGGVGSAVR
eukprot:1195750-Prorocentrum_minimum.AAC.7